MNYRCRSCKREFDLYAWIEHTTNWFPNVQLPQDPNTNVQVFTNYNSSSTVKTPVCPYCNSLEIEEVRE